MLAEMGLSEERRAFLRLHNPWVRFELPSDFTGNDYRWFITKLLADFVLWLNPEKNAHKSEEMGFGTRNWNNEASGIALVWVRDKFFTHSKMYLYDGEQVNFGNPASWKGVIFYDHREDDCRYGNAIKVFLIADAFEEYLKEKNIPHQRFNWKIGESPQ